MITITEFAEARRRPPPWGPGLWADRFEWLFEQARSDLSMARLVEADADARAISADLGVPLVDPTASYGVWAADGGALRVTAKGSTGLMTVSGRQPWAGGAGLVDRALVLVRDQAASVLVDVEVDRGSVDLSPWRTTTLADSATGTAVFDEAPAAVIADGQRYLERPGFWIGAIGVAACWAGAASGVLAAHVGGWRRSDPHSLAQLGAAAVDAAIAHAIVRDAAARLDSDVADGTAAVQRRARIVRFAVDEACRRAIDHLSVGAGPFPLTSDDDVIRRTAELLLTIRQSHGLRDVEPVGADVLAGRPDAHGSM